MTTLPYGMRDVKLTPWEGDTLAGTSVDLPNARTFSFSESEEFETLRGDDRHVAIRGRGAAVMWDLEAGGISLEAYAIMAGGEVTTTGVAPATVTTFRKKVSDVRSYFKAEGQAISDGGGDFHTVIYKCIASGDLEGEMTDGAFWLTSGSGEGLPVDVDGDEGVLYDFVQNETVTPIA